MAARSWSSRDWLGRVQQQPFFLFLHLFEPHSPYEPVEPFKSRYANDPYDGEIATADAILGRFLAELDRRGLYDRSLIVFFGDHSEGLDEHGEARRPAEHDGHEQHERREGAQVLLFLRLRRGVETRRAAAQKALAAYREAIRRSPQVVDSVVIEIANLELDRGDLKAAELNAQQAMKLDPEDAHLVLAAVAERRSDLATAEREARLAVGPRDAPRIPALIFLARLLAKERKLDEALAVITRADERVSSGAAHPVATLASTGGDILARLGRSSNAEAAFRDEIAHFPQTTEAYVKLALLLASEHRFGEIQPTLDAMVSASPTPATFFLAAKEMTDLGNEAGARDYRRRGERLAGAAAGRH